MQFTCNQWGTNLPRKCLSNKAPLRHPGTVVSEPKIWIALVKITGGPMGEHLMTICVTLFHCHHPTDLLLNAMWMQETSFDDLITVHIVSLLPPQNIWLLDELNKVGKMPWEISLHSDSKANMNRMAVSSQLINITISSLNERKLA